MIRTLSAFCCGCLLTAIIVLFIFSGECEKEALSFRVTPQGSFPGFHIQSYEFSIPLNRMELTALVHADDPEGFYGSGGAPMTIIVFRVKENGEFHYFALSGAQESRISEFQYLGKELELKNWAPAGAGFLKLDFLHKDASHASAWLSSSQITGSPAEDAAGEPIALDTRWLHADTYDKHAFEGKSFPVFLAEFQESLRREDRKTIAGLIHFPAELSGKLYFTRSEFLQDYQEIFHSGRKKAILETTIKDVGFSWRGATMPGGIFLDASQENAGPIQSITDPTGSQL